MTQQANAGYRQLRRGRHSIPGGLYLLTTVTIGRQRIFLDRHLAGVVSSLSAAANTWSPGRCLGWVLMPDHWHGVIELGHGTTLAATMQRFKGTTAHALNSSCQRRGAVWQQGFHDRALRQDEGIAATLRYIIANPVRAGLVEHPLNYPYWDTIYTADLAWLHDLQARRD